MIFGKPINGWWIRRMFSPAMYDVNYATVWTNTIRISGIKHLNGHIVKCNVLTKTPSICSYIQRVISITKEENIAVTLSSLEFCYKDVRPFWAIQCEGLSGLLVPCRRSIILAKQKYSCPWPATILNIENNKVLVHFFGDNRTGKLPSPKSNAQYTITII